MENKLGSNNVTYVHCNVESEKDLKNAIDTCVKKYGKIDCLFNNAGFVGDSSSIEDIEEAGYDKTMNVLLRAVVFGSKYAVKAMKAQGNGGSIISTASVAGISAGFGPMVYSVAKGAVMHFTKLLAVEQGPNNIRFNAICPGGILTPLLAGAGAGSPNENEWQTNPDAVKKRMEETANRMNLAQPIRRHGQPSDIAKTALFLASDLSEFVTGQSIAVDGGLTSGRDRAGDLQRNIDLVNDENAVKMMKFLGSMPEEKRMQFMFQARQRQMSNTGESNNKKVKIGSKM